MCEREAVIEVSLPPPHSSPARGLPCNTSRKASYKTYMHVLSALDLQHLHMGDAHQFTGKNT